MMRKSFAIGMAFAAVLALACFSVRAEDDDDLEKLAQALSDASVSLEQGMKASEAEGKPISGKFEVEDGALQLSVYTTKADGFAEVIVDHKTGSIKESEAITDADDLKEAKGEAMAKATLPLAAAVASAVNANDGFRAVSAVPMLEAANPWRPSP
jgi:hypothetical protein